MKFGNYLKENILNPWRIEYIQYDLLKMDLKSRQLDHEWSNQDELDFIQLFTNERNKVAQFIIRFSNQLLSRIQYSKHLLQSSTQEHQQTTDFLNNLDDTLIEIIFDIHDFSKFIQLNKLGFAKILKKHQKWTGIDHAHVPGYEYQTMDASLKSDWIASFYTHVSLIRHQCQQHVNDLEKSIAIMAPNKTPERRIRKYWVLPHHVSEVIATLCMQTHIVQPTKNSNQDFDFSVSNIYLDNNYMDTYLDRLADKENVRAIKCKRYGSLLNDCIYFENETHTTFCSSDISSKQRLKVERSQLNDFYSGSDYSSASCPTDEVNEKDAMEEQDQSNKTLFAEFVKDSILYSTLKPRLQCDYNRLSFKNHSSHELGLHVTLDTDIQFYKIDNQESYFTNNSNTSVAFPYAVLEIKLPTETKLDDPLLYWLNTFTKKSKLLQEVPRFSKYVQGTFQLTMDEKLSPPSWIVILEKGVHESVLRDGLSRSRSLRPLLNGQPYRSTVPYPLGNRLRESQLSKYRKSHRNSNKDYTSVSMAHLAIETDTKVLLDMPEKVQVTPSHPIYSAKSSFLFSPTSSFTKRTPNSDNIILDQDGNPIKYTNQKLSKKKKKTSKLSTVKIEPKVFFANERTFISWLQFCALLLTVALNLLNFGDHMSKVCGAIFLFIAMLLALYALARFQYRAWQLRTPSQTGRFDDIYGPAVLCVLIVAALIINFWLRFSHDEGTNQLYPTPVENNSTQY